MDYSGDIPPRPEERAELRLAANAAWLKRVKERHQDDSSHIDWAAKRMQEDNAKAVAAAKKDIEAERRAHKCYICRRSDPPRWARGFGLAAAVLLVVYFYATEQFPHDAALFGLAGLAAIGAAVASAAHESGKPADEAEIRRQFNQKPHD